MIPEALRTLLDGLTGGDGADAVPRGKGGATPDDAEDEREDDSADSTTPDDGAGTRTRSDIIAETGMTPNEYVREVLREHGGRAYQGTVGEETGLSTSGTSRLLSQMEEEGLITRISIGREKVVCLPDHEPEIATKGDAEEVASGV